MAGWYVMHMYIIWIWVKLLYEKSINYHTNKN